MADIQEILARNMKRARTRLGYSQARLAERTGTSTAFIGEIEICRKSPSLENLVNIAEALDMEAYELLLGEERKETVNKQTMLTALKKELEGKILEDMDSVFRKHRKG